MFKCKKQPHKIMNQHRRAFQIQITYNYQWHHFKNLVPAISQTDMCHSKMIMQRPELRLSCVVMLGFTLHPLSLSSTIPRDNSALARPPARSLSAPRAWCSSRAPQPRGSSPPHLLGGSNFLHHTGRPWKQNGRTAIHVHQI